MSDDPADSFPKRLEEKVRDLMLANPDLDEIVVMIRGEPFAVPIKLYPFASVFITQRAAGEGEHGYTDDTGPTRYLIYDGYISIEVAHRDAPAMVRTADRKIDVPSHDIALRLTAAALNTLEAWGNGPPGIIDDVDKVVSQDGKEDTSTVWFDRTAWGLQNRPNNASDVGAIEFHVASRRKEY